MGIFKNRGAAREISTEFQCENGFEPTKYGRINFGARMGATDHLFFSIMSPPITRVVICWNNIGSLCSDCNV